MKIQLFIAVSDPDYLDYLSNVLIEKYSDTFEVSICSNTSYVRELLQKKPIDIGLFDIETADTVNLSSLSFTLLLVDKGDIIPENYINFGRIQKYQRISSIVANILEQYSAIVAGDKLFDGQQTHITAVWSPTGGSGKTTVALAYSANKATDENTVVYLDLEFFSSCEVYFNNSGKSISTVFEKLDLDNNIPLLLQSIRQKDSGSGICYYIRPNNYDDINILTTSDIEVLVKSAAQGIDNLVIDLASICDDRIQKIFEIADEVVIVVDNSRTSYSKWEQFVSQHDVYQKIRNKICVVGNRGAKTDPNQSERNILLPIVQSKDPVDVYKTLSAYFNE